MDLPRPKNILLFTEGFPVSGVTEDAFVTPELGYLAQGFEKVVIVPPIWGGKVNVYHDIAVDSSYAKAEVENVSRWKAVIRPRLWKDCMANRLNVRRQLEYERFERWISGFLANNKMGNDDTILYTFWLAREAEFVGCYATKHGIRAVARAHRFDIFDMTDTRFRREALLGFESICPCSEDGANALRSRHPRLADRIRVSYLGVEKRNAAAMNPLSHGKSPITFFSCHNLIRRKRGLLCAKCLVALAKANPNLDFHWILVGDGEERSAIESVALNLPSNLKFEMRGKIENAKVHEIYVSEPIDFSVLLSDSEGLAVMDQESMSYGVPVIGTDVGGTRECIIDGENGVLLRPEFTIDEFVARMAPLLLHPQIRMRHSAYGTFKSRFDATVTRRVFVNRVLLKL